MQTDIGNLYEKCRALVTFAKTSTNVQSHLKTTLKQGGLTRPWRGLTNLMGSVLANCDSSNSTLKNILKERKRESLLCDIDENLLRQVYNVLVDGVIVFDMLEQSLKPTLQNVAPAFYLLRNAWDRTVAGEDRRIKALKKELVSQIDDKVWGSITTLHFAATYLDPTLNKFLFVSSAADQQLFIEQAKVCIFAYAADEYNRHLNLYNPSSLSQTGISVPAQPLTHSQAAPSTTSFEVESTANLEVESGPTPAKTMKKDPLAQFRLAAAVAHHATGNTQTDSHQHYVCYSQFKAEVEREIIMFETMQGPFEDFQHSTSAKSEPNEASNGFDSMFNPVAWWGLNVKKFPLLAKIAKKIYVIPASSAESERHFSTAGKITRKDRANLSAATVEASVLVAQALKKKLIC